MIETLGIVTTSLIIFFGTFFVVFIYIIRNLYIKNSIYESWLANIILRIEELQTRVKELDDKKIFEKDDEVGFIFSEIAELIKDFDTNKK